MLRIVQNSSAAGAKAYYSTADYYTEGQELQGTWRGLGAARLGLVGEIRKPEWDALCDNLHPETGTKLTPRIKEPRRVGYDFNFHAPKSLSVLYALTQDDRLLTAFRESVDATMSDIEREMKARVRGNGRNEDRVTGNLAWGEFVHFTARPVDGVPDPHLHAHCFAFNATYDPDERRWKAGQFADLKGDGPYFEAVFHSRLAHGLQQLGVPVERTRTGWEISGIPKAVNEKFSRRTAKIAEEARRMGISDPALLGELGAMTRDRKLKNLSMNELREVWRSRLDRSAVTAIETVAERIGTEALPIDDGRAAHAVQLALSQCFERTAVVPERTLLTEALKRGVGTSSPEAMIELVSREPLVRRDRAGRSYVTTQEVLAEEQRMLAFAREGRGTCRPLGSPDHPLPEGLSAGQRRAAMDALTSKDRVILIRGAAGTGKTRMMTATVDGIKAGGHKVFTFAPSAAASRGVLRKEGFENAETVSRLLVDPKLQEAAQNQVLWIDEAGLLGSRTTAKLFELAGRVNARVILSGDRKQHSSPERGGMLRLLETDAGLVSSELKEIRRQTGEYKAAVRALSEGKVAQGFRRLDDLGWIREIGDADRNRALAAAYLQSLGQPGETLVVAPSHAEAEQVTAEIRASLQRAGTLGRKERPIPVLKPLHLTEAERADKISYQDGDVLIFHQNAKGHRRGEQLVVGHSEVPFEQAARFTVYRPSEIPVAVGDRIRITKNGVAADGKTRLNNGDIYSIKKIQRNGAIVLSNGAKLPPAFRHLAYGYAVTSHASQGRSVDRVIIGQSSYSFKASSREQFYVSVSRGKQKATIFTDDKRALLEAVSQGDERLTATDLVIGREPFAGERDRARSMPSPASHFIPATAVGQEVTLER